VTRLDALALAIGAARRRRFAIAAAIALPMLAGAAAVALRVGGAAVGAAVVALGVAAFAVVVRRALGRMDARWFARRLDRDATREDSSDLLFGDPATHGPLQRLQRERVAATLGSAATVLRPDWPRRALGAAWLGGAALVAFAWFWPVARFDGDVARAPAGTTVVAPTRTTLVAAALTLSPPGYTGLATTTQPDLSAKVPAGTTLRWSLALSPQPRAVELRMHDGRVVALARTRADDGAERWTGETVLARSALYSIVVVDGLPLADDTRHRLDALPDAPPRIRVVEPARSLTLRTPGQRGFALRFEASDDHGLGSARWLVTLAQGSGEQVAVSERVLPARGEGETRAKVYATTLDLGSLGFAQGDDLIVRLELADNRAPSPQRARSASVILRWPPPASSESTGMEGLVKRALPAYFRSQRQIIIDTEALVAERGRLDAERFGAKSDAIGVDQRILRMRYGEFLGEENAGQPDAAGHEEHAGEPPEGFGRAIEVLEAYGHTHDDAEAATLLDPQTRALLKKALDAMWQSEGALRQAQPEAALPHQYRALAYIKQVQQATRIFLQRVGLELPPIDEARRMTGKRDGIGDRRDDLQPADVDAPPALALWQALGRGPADGATLDAFADWLRAHEDSVDDALGLVAAIDTVRARPDCDECRARLRARLWPLLPRTVPAAAARGRADAEGAAYLDALARGAEE
jgi:hypothetical protein